MATITDGVVTITPDLVLGWESTREARTQVHPVIGRTDPEVTLRPAALRTGTLSLFFLELEDAQDAEAAHAVPAVWEVHPDPAAPTLQVVWYVVSGPLVLRAEGPDLRRWVLEVGYTEVIQ